MVRAGSGRWLMIGGPAPRCRAARASRNRERTGVSDHTRITWPPGSRFNRFEQTDRRITGVDSIRSSRRADGSGQVLQPRLDVGKVRTSSSLELQYYVFEEAPPVLLRRGDEPWPIHRVWRAIGPGRSPARSATEALAYWRSELSAGPFRLAGGRRHDVARFVLEVVESAHAPGGS